MRGEKERQIWTYGRVLYLSGDGRVMEIIGITNTMVEGAGSTNRNNLPILN